MAVFRGLAVPPPAAQCGLAAAVLPYLRPWRVTVRLVQMRAGEGLRQNRGAVAVFVMLAAVAAVAMMAGARSNTGPPGHAALGAMTAEEADHMFRNAKPLGYPHVPAPSSHLRSATLPARKHGPNPARALIVLRFANVKPESTNTLWSHAR